MLILSVVLFALAATLGVFLALAIFSKKETSKPVALAHGAAGAAGLALVIVYAARQPSQALTIGIVLLVVAALGGAILFANDLRKKPGPKGLIAIHALVAVAAVAIVMSVAFG